MNLRHHKTEPEIESSLYFDEKEVTKALIEYAKQKDYGFLAEEEIAFHFWENAMSSDGDPHFELRVGCPGTTAGIIKIKGGVG